MPAPRFHPFWRLLLCALGVLAASSLVLGVMQAALFTSARLSNRDPIDESLRFWSDSKNLLIATALAYPFTLLVLIVCRHTLDKRSLGSLGLSAEGNATPKPLPVRSFFQGALCGVLAISLLFGLLWTTGAVRIEGFSPETFEGGAVIAFGMLCLYALLFFAVGWMEELVFRGYALHNLAAWMGIPAAIAIQAIFFAFAHAGNGARPDAAPGIQTFLDARWALINIALVGWFFALCYLKSGTLWFPIGFHAAWNWTLGCVWSLPVSGIKVFRVLDVSSSSNTALSGGAFGAEASVLLIPILLALIALMHGLPDHPQARRDLALLSPPFDNVPNEQAVEEVEEPEDPNRERLFKTSMRAEAAPEIAPSELAALTRELEQSRQRAAQSAGASATLEPPRDPQAATSNEQAVEIAIPATPREEVETISTAPTPATHSAPANVETPDAAPDVAPSATIPTAPEFPTETSPDAAPEPPRAPTKKPRW